MGMAITALIGTIATLSSMVFWIAAIPAVITYAVGVKFRSKGALLIAAGGAIALGAVTGAPIYFLVDLIAVAVAVVMAWEKLSPTVEQKIASQRTKDEERLQREQNAQQIYAEKEAARSAYLASDEYKWVLATRQLELKRKMESRRELLIVVVVCCLGFLLIKFFPAAGVNPVAQKTPVSQTQIARQAIQPLAPLPNREQSKNAYTHDRRSDSSAQNYKKKNNPSNAGDLKVQNSKLQTCLKLVLPAT